MCREWLVSLLSDNCSAMLAQSVRLLLALIPGSSGCVVVRAGISLALATVHSTFIQLAYGMSIFPSIMQAALAHLSIHLSRLEGELSPLSRFPTSRPNYLPIRVLLPCLTRLGSAIKYGIFQYYTDKNNFCQRFLKPRKVTLHNFYKLKLRKVAYFVDMISKKPSKGESVIISHAWCMAG